MATSSSGVAEDVSVSESMVSSASCFVNNTDMLKRGFLRRKRFQGRHYRVLTNAIATPALLLPAPLNDGPQPRPQPVDALAELAVLPLLLTVLALAGVEDAVGVALAEGGQSKVGRVHFFSPSQKTSCWCAALSRTHKCCLNLFLPSTSQVWLDGFLLLFFDIEGPGGFEILFPLFFFFLG